MANTVVDFLPIAGRLHPDFFQPSFHRLLWRIEREMPLSNHAISVLSLPDMTKDVWSLLTLAHHSFRHRATEEIKNKLVSILALDPHSSEALYLAYDVARELGRDDEILATIEELKKIDKNDPRLLIRIAERMIEQGKPMLMIWSLLETGLDRNALDLFPILLDLIVLTREESGDDVAYPLLEAIYLKFPEKTFRSFSNILMTLHADMVNRPSRQRIACSERSCYPGDLSSDLWDIYYHLPLRSTWLLQRERVLGQIVVSSAYLDTYAMLLYVDIVQRRNHGRARHCLKRALERTGTSIDVNLIAKSAFNLAKLNALVRIKDTEIIPWLEFAVENVPDSVDYVATLINSLINTPGNTEKINDRIAVLLAKGQTPYFIIQLLEKTSRLPQNLAKPLLESISIEMIDDAPSFFSYLLKTYEYGLSSLFEHALTILKKKLVSYDSITRYLLGLLHITGRYEDILEILERLRPAEKSASYEKHYKTVAKILGFQSANLSLKTNPSARPNILFITADAFNATRLHYDGYLRAITPNLDELAGRSLSFTSAFATNSATANSAVSFNTGILSYIGGSTLGQNLLDDRFTTIAERMSAVGYDTAAFVNNSHFNRGSGFEQGFTHYVDTSRNNEDLLDKFLRMANDGTIRRPYFVWIHLLSPHGPYLAPYDIVEKVLAMPRPDLPGVPEKPLGLDDWPTWPIPKYNFDGFNLDPTWYFNRYDAEVMYLDRCLAPVFKWVYSQNHTGLLFSADHGESLGRHGVFFNHGTTLYNDELRVPCLLYAPWLDIAGRRHDAPVSTIDYLPTFIEISEMARCKECSGESLLSQLRQGQRLKPLIALLVDNGIFSKLAMIDGPEKFIYEPGSDRNDEKKNELFSIYDDPDEKDNRFAREREKARKALDKIETWLEGNPPQRVDLKNTDRRPAHQTDERLERLRTLGYLE